MPRRRDVHRADLGLRKKPIARGEMTWSVCCILRRFARHLVQGSRGTRFAAACDSLRIDRHLACARREYGPKASRLTPLACSGESRTCRRWIGQLPTATRLHYSPRHRRLAAGTMVNIRVQTGDFDIAKELAAIRGANPRIGAVASSLAWCAISTMAMTYPHWRWNTIRA